MNFKGSLNQPSVFHLKIRKADEKTGLSLLSYQDSNLDKQIQNLLCYHYTIAHRCGHNLNNLLKTARVEPQKEPKLAFFLSNLSNPPNGFRPKSCERGRIYPKESTEELPDGFPKFPQTSLLPAQQDPIHQFSEQARYAHPDSP